jgi:hypothetical protein
MKVLLVLAMAVAVSTASFSDLIHKRTGPLVKDAFHQIKADLHLNVKGRGRNADVEFEAEFVHAMEQHIDTVLGDIDVIFNAGEAVSGSLTDDLHAATRDMAFLAEHPLATPEQNEAAFAAIFQNVAGLLGQDEAVTPLGRNAAVAIPPQVIALIQAILARPGAQEALESSPLYQCLDKQLEAEGGLNYEYLKELNAQGNLNADYLMNSPAVQHCIREQGGIAAIITNSDIIRRLKELVTSLDLTETVNSAIRTILGETLGNQVIELLKQSQMATFGFWDTITGGIGAVVDKIKDIVSRIYESVVEKFNQLRAFVFDIMDNGWAKIAEMGKAAAQQLLDSIAPYYCDIGRAAASLVSRLIASFIGLTIPPSIIVAVGGKIVEIITGNPTSCS